MFNVEYMPSKINGGYEVVIGIDPDTDRSGVATITRSTLKVELKALTFAELIRHLQWVSLTCKGNDIPFMVVVEDSWSIKPVFHLNPKMSQRLVASIGCDVGRCQETGKKIFEICEYLDIPVKAVKPLKKIWGKDGKSKISQKEIEVFMGKLRAVGADGHLKMPNQEHRDSALLAWHELNLPIKINMKLWN